LADHHVKEYHRTKKFPADRLLHKVVESDTEESDPKEEKEPK
jgi:hypothetical protein